VWATGPRGPGEGGIVSYQRLVNVSFKVDVDLLRELDEYAKSRGMERSEVIRRAIAWYLKSHTRPSITPRMTVYDASNVNSSNNTPRIRVR
jgi:metal-responsive CopG/Arc/MetJ family transcriptional regulator